MKKFAQVILIAGLAVSVAPAAPQAKPDKKTDQQAAPKEATDVVCGMTIDTKDSETSVYKGKTYYFCSSADKKEFDKSPDKYIKEANKK